jgi:carbon storage regulator
MLVLTRKKEEVIRVGNQGIVKITIVEIRGDKVRVGIDAPKNVPIHREEVFKAILSGTLSQLEEKLDYLENVTCKAEEAE